MSNYSVSLLKNCFFLFFSRLKYVILNYLIYFSGLVKEIMNYLLQDEQYWRGRSIVNKNSEEYKYQVGLQDLPGKIFQVSHRICSISISDFQKNLKNSLNISLKIYLILVTAATKAELALKSLVPDLNQIYKYPGQIGNISHELTPRRIIRPGVF